MSFSQRYGYKDVRKGVQRESMDQALRNRLWDIVDEHLCGILRSCFTYDQLWGTERGLSEPGYTAAYWLWHDYYKLPWDEAGRPSQILAYIRRRFFECEWHEVYDFLEFTAPVLHALNRDSAEAFVKGCNAVLTEEHSAWRFVGARIADITSDDEIGAIEQAIYDAKDLPGAKAHLERALELHSARPDADYRNSVKESISAVESVACVIADEPKADLSKALHVIKAKGGVEIHGALRRALDALYGYASDEGGVRHKMLEEAAVGRAESQFMLVACSASVSYLIAKASEGAIDSGSV